MPLGPYPDASCPTGTTLIPRLSWTKFVCEGGGSVQAPVCPAGSTPHVVITDARQFSVNCIPAGTALYDILSSDPSAWPCRPGDFFGMATDTLAMKCIPSGAAAASPPQADGSLDSLSTQLASLRSQYTALASQAVATPAQLQTLLPQIQSLNQQIATVLDRMLTEMQYARQGPNSDAYRTQLVEQLTRIQSDYNGLKTNTDTMQTLNRIRAFQDTTWQGTLFTYLGILLIAAVVLVLVILFRRQKSESATMPSASPAAIPPLT